MGRGKKLGGRGVGVEEEREGEGEAKKKQLFFRNKHRKIIKGKGEKKVRGAQQQEYYYL